MTKIYLKRNQVVCNIQESLEVFGITPFLPVPELLDYLISVKNSWEFGKDHSSYLDSLNIPESVKSSADELFFFCGFPYILFSSLDDALLFKLAVQH